MKYETVNILLESDEFEVDIQYTIEKGGIGGYEFWGCQHFQLYDEIEIHDIQTSHQPFNELEFETQVAIILDQNEETLLHI